MAAPKKLHLQLILLLSICSVLSWKPWLSSASSGTVSTEEKVKLELYYETLCPYCSRFIAKYLPQLFDTGLISITDLSFIPYGNAKIGPNATITCQHGEYECLLNTVEACAIDAWPDLSEHFPFIYCVENLVYEGKYTAWETCFANLGMDPTPVTDCSASGRGKELELQYAAVTNALEPPHTYVPWVVVDGQPLYEDYMNFISYICKAYKGSTKIPACSELSATVSHLGILRLLNPFW
ncbi:PREDICTED: gamma-interferon-inducible lysosomal thiol reductase-like [Ipomoea nil]|uniref:gamma-interferon-inducible lysosomal thiol reductase-like n=1 Tax=Ipomoea nil TaxID=35883 RepID=UPI000901E625|nr:PREDICTED: gamma-interferon-inducible lysosomal thiol reductase-like [Ipomoea nil]